MSSTKQVFHKTGLLQNRPSTKQVFYKTGLLQNRSSTEQVFYRTGHLQNRSSTKQVFYKTGLLQNRYSTKQVFYKTDILQNRSSAEQIFYKTGLLQNRCSTKQIFYTAGILQNRYSTKQMSWRVFKNPGKKVSAELTASSFAKPLEITLTLTPLWIFFPKKIWLFLLHWPAAQVWKGASQRYETLLKPCLEYTTKMENQRLKFFQSQRLSLFFWFSHYFPWTCFWFLRILVNKMVL